METATERLDRITKHLNAGGKVMAVTYTKATMYDKRHVSMFRVSGNDLLVQRGKKWDCLNFTPIRFSNLNA